ncbi:MAG TPA: cytochrome c3 family protein [Verrucomicrobiae bacterium]
MQRISFAANCQACHSLQFDPKNPELMLPHGNATAVRAFLRSLPTQYADLAVKKGITRPNEIQSFVAKQIEQLRERVRSGEDFERQVFFTTDPYKPQRQGNSPTRSSFYGCAFCHEVKPVANTAPIITKPILVDRWMVRANFDHAKHSSVKCDDCHHATQSHDTSDVLMPTKASCVICHSPQGKVVAECITCHTFHAPPQTAMVDLGQTPAISVKQMMLGRVSALR